MGIILQFLVRNIREKKLRTALIIISIMLSSSLFFATMAMSTTMEEIYANRLRQYFGSAQLMVHADRRSPSWHLAPLSDDRLPPSAEYAAGMVQTGGEFKHEDQIIQVNITGLEFTDLQRMNPVTLEEDDGVLPFAGRKTLIGRSVADRYGLETGDSVVIEIQNRPFRFKVAGIVTSNGFFMDDGSSTMFLIPRETLLSFFGIRGRVGTLYVKPVSDDRLEECRAALQALFPRYVVRETVTRKEIRQWTDNVTIPFRVMLVLVIAISVFIIFTSFQVITTERLPVIGTFRSIGATRKTTDFVLFGESIMYGVLGGILGCAAGIGFLYVMIRLSVSGWMSQGGIRLVFHEWQIAATFLLAVVLSFVSAAIPIVKISRIPVKDIILGLYKHTSKFTHARLITGIVLITAGLTIPFFVPGGLALIIDTVCILLTITGITMLVPLFTGLFVRMLEPVFRTLFGNIGILAAKNIRENPGILNNVTLLAIAISSIFMINTISESVMYSVSALFDDMRYELIMSTWQIDRTIVQSVKAVDGVEDVYGIFSTRDIVITGIDTKIRYIQGVRPDSFPAFRYTRRNGKTVDVSVLDEGRNILITDLFAKQYALKKNDVLPLEFPTGKQNYTVAGFFTSQDANGSYALIGDRFLKMDANLTWYNNLWIKTNEDPAAVQERIKAKFARRRPWVQQIAVQKKENMKSNEQMFMILKGFSFMMLLIGTVGIVNNFIISFIERKRSFALLRSVGMSRVQNRSMIFLEAAACGAAGSILGIITGLMIMIIVPLLMSAIRLSVPIVFVPWIAGSLICGGIAITIIASLSPAMRSSKLNILESLRYE